MSITHAPLPKQLFGRALAQRTRGGWALTQLRARVLPALLLALGLAACGGGQYGFARTYSPLASEHSLFERAQQPTYQDLLRDPHRYEKTEVAWFGVVSNVTAEAEGRTRLTLNLRAHQARHLCSDDSRSSCRVTVSEAQLGVFTVDLALKPEEKSGKERIWLGSLLKIYGTHSGEYNEETGPVLNVAYYRHWPRGFYVTTAARGTMRR